MQRSWLRDALQQDLVRMGLGALAVLLVVTAIAATGAPASRGTASTPGTPKPTAQPAVVVRPSPTVTHRPAAVSVAPAPRHGKHHGKGKRD